MRFVTELKNDLAGLATLRDWLGSNMQPVGEFKAEFRATICANCDKNEKGNWWDGAKSAIADQIRKQIELRNRLKLQTKLDGSLGTCGVCSCNIPLLVHVPTEIISEREPPDRVSTYPAYCWKRVELESL